MRKISFAAVLSILATSASATTVAPPPAPAPLATPPGIIFQVTRTGVFFADTAGKSIYTADADCTGECTQSWKPVTAAADAKAFGDWTVTARADGTKQWALKGKQLYTSVKDEKPGEMKGAADGWRAAAFQPPMPAILPPDIAVREVPALPGQVLVNAEGRTLYTARGECTGACAERWTPVTAPAIAREAGDFTAVKRKDGSRQWAYKGDGLYTFVNDLEPGDMFGRGESGLFTVAALTTYFMPKGVTIRASTDDPIHPYILVDENLRTLYAREHWLYTQTFHAKNGDRNSAVSGRGIGTQGCTGDCLKRWKPLAAPADAVGSGHWTVLTRDDGSKQWAYQNFALYTYLGDEHVGDKRGNEIFDLWEKDLVGLPPPIPTSTASVMYWRAAAP